MTAIEGMQQSWNAAGRSAGDLYTTAWACGCVLEPGEPADSPRAMAQAGPRAAVLLHRAADRRHGGLEEHLAGAAVGAENRSTATSPWRAASSRRTRAT